MSKMDEYKEVMRADTHILALSAVDIVEGYDFEDEELQSVLGGKTTKSEDEIYELILEVCRKNPLNLQPVASGFNEFIQPLLGKL